MISPLRPTTPPRGVSKEHVVTRFACSFGRLIVGGALCLLAIAIPQTTRAQGPIPGVSGPGRAVPRAESVAAPPAGAPVAMRQHGYYEHWHGTRQYSGHYQPEHRDLYSSQMEHSAYSTSSGPYGFALGTAALAGFADVAARPVGQGFAAGMNSPWYFAPGYWNSPNSNSTSIQPSPYFPFVPSPYQQPQVVAPWGGFQQPMYHGNWGQGQNMPGFGWGYAPQRMAPVPPAAAFPYLPQPTPFVDPSGAAEF